MKWTPDQLDYYRKMVNACSGLSIRETISRCFDDAAFQPPALPGAIEAAEAALGCRLPDSLREFYAETNGVHAHYGTELVMPLQAAVEENEDLRYSPEYRELYMPFNHMLVFGGAGNGDRFFFPIRADGSIWFTVFLWDHECDSREYFANGLGDLFLRHATNLL